MAAFSKLSLDLLSLGAPVRLVQSCHDDALDEVRHARACWDLARQLGGSVQAGEAPLPDVACLSLATTPAMVAVESYVQGAYLERVSADLAQELIPRTGDARVASVLRRIEEDERRHSEHGWEIVEWCLSIDEGPVREALEAVRFGAPVHATTGANLTRWGLADPDLVAAVDVCVRREVEARLTALLAPADRRRASGARA